MTKSPCPQCGTPRDPAEPCPICLLRLAAAPDSQVLPETETDATKSFHPVPDVETIKQAFPQLEIIEQIGRGGMGTVFKARQPKLDRFVSLKILSEKLAEKPTFAERFAQEGKLLARLSHPNIVTVHDFGQVEVVDDAGKKLTLYFLILEYVDGVNLRQAMREERFTPEQALAIVPKICEALQYAHDEGVLHRDIKPENILLDTKGRVKIADFGIGKLTQASEATSKLAQASQHEPNLTATGVVLGTPNYMAPEQLETPNTVDHRADIYSLGVVFYELLTGELPKGRLTPPSEKTPVNAEIDGIVLKALQRDRTQRHQSAGELKTEIETAAVTHPTADKSFMQFVKQQGLRFKIGIIGATVAGIGLFYMAELPTENFFLGSIAKLCLVSFLIFFGIDIYLRYKNFLSLSADELETKQYKSINNRKKNISIAVIIAIFLSLFSCIVPFFVIHMGIFDDYTRLTETELSHQMNNQHARLEQAKTPEEKEQIEKELAPVRDEYNRRYNQNATTFNMIAVFSSIVLAGSGMILGGRHLVRMRRGQCVSGFLPATFATIFPLVALSWFFIALYTLNHFGEGMTIGLITNPHYYTFHGIVCLVVITLVIALIAFAVAWCVKCWVYPRAKSIHSKPTHRLAMASILFSSISLILLFVEPALMRQYQNPLRQANAKKQLAENQVTLMQACVDYDKNELERIKTHPDAMPPENFQLRNEAQKSVLEARLAIDQKWLAQRKNELQEVAQELTFVQNMTQDHPWLEWCYYGFIWAVPPSLALIGLIVGVIHLARIAKTEDKPGVMLVSLSVLCSPILVLAGFMVAFMLTIEGVM